MRDDLCIIFLFQFLSLNNKNKLKFQLEFESSVHDSALFNLPFLSAMCYDLNNDLS